MKNLIFKAKMNFYSKLIQDADSDSNALFRSVDKPLLRTPERKLPSASSSQLLANNFVHFLKDKIINIRNKLSSFTPADPDSFVDLDSSPPMLSGFFFTYIYGRIAKYCQKTAI